MNLRSLFSIIWILVFSAHTIYTACPPKDELPKQCDYIIVGAGAAGATIASRVSENPNIIVCLFEAGIKDTDGEFASAVTIPRAYGALAVGDYTYNTSTVRQKNLNGRALSVGMGKTLGGSTSHNFMAYFRGYKADYDFWAKNGATGWDFNSNLPFFIKSENISIEELRNSPTHGTCGPLGISSAQTEFHRPLWELWKRSAKEVSFDVGECNRESPFGTKAGGVCPMQATIQNGKRESTSTAFLQPSLGRRNLFIVTEALVGRILIRGKRAYGIRYKKHERIFTVIATKEVIVSAGTFESPKLLQISGIGPKFLLRRLKIRPHVILPVGQNTMDHVLWIFDVEFKSGSVPVVTLDDLRDPKTVGEYLFQAKGLWAVNGFPIAVFLDFIKQKHNWPEAEFQLFDGFYLNLASFADVKAGKLTNNGTGISVGFFLLHPKSRGTVKAKSTDPEDNPLIDPKYFSDPNDIPTFTKGVDLNGDFEGKVELTQITGIGRPGNVLYLNKELFRINPVHPAEVGTGLAGEYYSLCRFMPLKPEKAPVMSLKAPIRLNILANAPSMRKVGATFRILPGGIFGAESPDECFSNFKPYSDEFWDCVLRKQAAAGLHAVRSCPIGQKGDRWAVVDPELRVFGIRGLRVADASVMPEVSSANTNGPSIMIGERAADFILSDYRNKKYT